MHVVMSECLAVCERVTVRGCGVGDLEAWNATQKLEVAQVQETRSAGKPTPPTRGMVIAMMAGKGCVEVCSEVTQVRVSARKSTPPARGMVTAMVAGKGWVEQRVCSLNSADSLKE